MSTVVWILESDYPAVTQLETDYDAVDIVYQIIPDPAEKAREDEPANSACLPNQSTSSARPKDEVGKTLLIEHPRDSNRHPHALSFKSRDSESLRN